jgi:hypothetical protein
LPLFPADLFSPAKLGVFERNVMEEAIGITLKIMSIVLPTKPSLIAVVSRLLDPTIPYYSGKIPAYLRPIREGKFMFL